MQNLILKDRPIFKMAQLKHRRIHYGNKNKEETDHRKNLTVRRPLGPRPRLGSLSGTTSIILANKSSFFPVSAVSMDVNLDLLSGLKDLESSFQEEFNSTKLGM